MINKICTAKEAVALVNDEDCIVYTGFIRSMAAEELFFELMNRFDETCSPNNLTLLHGACSSTFLNGACIGMNCLGKEGLLKRSINGFYGNADFIKQMIYDEKLEAYNFPMGAVNQLLRSFALGHKGTLSKIGLKTFVDPRLEGGKTNRSCSEDFVKVVELEGEEFLYYTAPKPNVAFLRGTTADEYGNITMEEEAIYSLSRVAAMATYQNGGTVMVQVKRVVKGGTLNAQSVHIPGIFVDKVVVCSNPEEFHRQSLNTLYSPILSGDKKMVTNGHDKEMPLDERKMIGRRAAMELSPNDVVNLGIGIPDAVGSVAGEENVDDMIVLTVETGTIGGIPMPKGDFGTTANAWAMVAEDRQFDLYDGGGLDICFLGCAEVSPKGDVNVSKFPGNIMGCGGFIDITQPTKKVVFCATFTAGGLKIDVSDGKLVIVQEGKHIKFKKDIMQVTFSGDYANETHQDVCYVTERCVFKLTPAGLELVEIAPGIDLEKDILANMEFKPAISKDLKLMNPKIFSTALMGLRDYIDANAKYQDS